MVRTTRSVLDLSLLNIFALVFPLRYLPIRFLSFNAYAIQWLRTNGCPWDASTCYEAAIAGRLDILEVGDRRAVLRCASAVVEGETRPCT